jgi:hypothetical protein
VILRQPSSQAGSPAPIIAVSFEPGVAVAQPATSGGLSPATPITIAGLQGWEYHQAGLTTPSSSDFIVLPYGGGRLQITATRGPSANLVPQAEEILKTLEVAP